ncbi:MAG TPA: glycosyltransferase family 2 protein [Actinomycetales bacterium]|nr:glycosyltransferase family 2 protein [Actinomycetales bacterium]
MSGWLPDGGRHVLVDLLSWFDVSVLLYFLAINSSYLLLIALAALEFGSLLRRVPFAGYDEAYASPLTLPVSVVVPAYNEQAGIVESVRGMLSLRYPQHEIVVVDDGSTDATVALLTSAFDLQPVPRRVPDDVPTRGEVLEVLMSPIVPLTVVRTTNSGRSDSLNTGVNVARYPLVCFVDADSILDPEALLTVGKPFADDPVRVVGTGGVVRVVNDCSVSFGRVVDVRVPQGWLPRIQVVEYLRAFLMGRTGWSRLRALTIISGAFGMFRRDVVVDVGGLDPTNLGEDFDLVTRIHRRMHDLKRPYRVVFVAEPVVWTEVPATVGVLRRQRKRWHRGLTQTLWRHKRMLLNPRYGRIGLVALPYLVVFELLAPVLELLGLVAIVVGLTIGAVNLPFALLFALVAFGYSFFLTVASLTLEEFSFHRYRRWGDLGWLVMATMAENLGYRQLTAVWRLEGLWEELRGRGYEWGAMTRVGFTGTTPADSDQVGHAEAARAGGTS